MDIIEPELGGWCWPGCGGIPGWLRMSGDGWA